MGCLNYYRLGCFHNDWRRSNHNGWGCHLLHRLLKNRSVSTRCTRRTLWANQGLSGGTCGTGCTGLTRFTRIPLGTSLAVSTRTTR